MFKRDARTGRVTGYTDFDAQVARPSVFAERAAPMAKGNLPSSWNPDPGKGRAPARRAHESRGRTSCQPATDHDQQLLQTLRRRFQDRSTSGFTVMDFNYALGSPVDALAQA